jgi:hypothetical protein
MVKIQASGEAVHDQIFVDNVSFKAEAVPNPKDVCTATNTDAWGTLLSEDFQTSVNGGMGVFTSPGDDAKRVGSTDGTISVSGFHSARIRDRSDGDSAITSNSFSVNAVSALYVNFKFKGIGMENGDDFFVEIEYDGSGAWIDVAQIVSGVDFVDAAADPTAAFNDYCLLWGIPNGVINAKIRFRSDGDGDADQVFIDDILVKGGSYQF